MPEPQAVLAPLTRAALVLVVTVDPGEDNAARVRSFAADLSGLVRSVGFRDLDAGLSCVAGFGSDVWPRLFSSPAPAELHPFRALAGDRHRAPATPGDMVPFGSPAAGEFGTYFIGYAKTPAVLERMLSNMVIGDPPGTYDRILDFSTAVTGSLFFVPAASLLEQFADGAA